MRSRQFREEGGIKIRERFWDWAREKGMDRHYPLAGLRAAFTTVNNLVYDCKQGQKAMKEHVIGFRVDWNEYRRIEEQAEKRGEEVNEWCRNLVLSESGKDFGLTASERILLEELAVIRNLVGRLLRETLSPEEMAKVRQEADQNYAAFGRKLLEKRAAKPEAKDKTA